MAVSRIKTSSVLQGFPKSRSLLAGYPPLMAAPTATAGNATASVAFTAVSGATSYTVLSTPGSLTGTGASSPITVSSLTNGTAYTFQISATNSAGTGAYSAASNSVTPVDPAAFDSIATLSPSGSTSVTFSSIPSTYKSLQIRMSTWFGSGSNVALRYNSDNGSNYTKKAVYARSNSTTVWDGGYSQSLGNILGGYDAVNSGYPANAIIDIYGYNNSSTVTSHIFRGGQDTNGASTADVVLGNGSWNSTSTVTSITIIASVAFAANSKIALYGIK